MAFGRLTTKFRIFRAPLEVNLDNVGNVVEVCARLHNFVINEQNENGDSLQIDPFEHRGVPGSLGYMPSDLDDEETGELDEENEEMMGPLYSIAGLPPRDPESHRE